MNQEPDAAPVLPSTSVLYHGDCLDVMPTLTAKSIAMVFADLPYGRLQLAWDLPIEPGKLWTCLDTISKTNAAKIFTATNPFAASLIMSNLKEFKHDLIWQKTRPSGAMLSKKQVMRDHEHILMFYKKQCTYNPQMTRVTEKNAYRPLTKTVLVDQSRIYGGGTMAKPVRARMDLGWRYPRSVQVFGSLKSTHYLHPTQKPVALIEWLIKTYTNPGDTVLDPTFGSCTTGVACARLGRNFIGIEKDGEYFRIGRERVDAERARLGLQPCQAITGATTHASKTDP